MRRLGPVPALLTTAALAVAVLAGCGEEGGSSASDDTSPSSSPSTSTSTPGTSTPTPEPAPSETQPTKSAPIDPGGVPFELVEMVSGTAGRGELSPQAASLGTDTEVARFVDGLSPQLANDVRAAVAAAEVPAGQQLYGAVVGLGCDVPPGVLVSRSGTGLQISGQKVVDPLQECFAAVTSVAVVAAAG